MKCFDVKTVLLIGTIFLFSLETLAEDLEKERREALDAMLASNPIVIFSGPCPEPWRQLDILDGRVPIGENPALPSGKTENGLAVRVLGDTGGEEEHVLSEDELPSHKHRTVLAGDNFNSEWKAGNPGVALHGDRWQQKHDRSYTAPAGESRAHNNMPPFAVVSFCELRPSGG